MERFCLFLPKEEQIDIFSSFSFGVPFIDLHSL